LVGQRIERLNPKVRLPDLSIVPVIHYRSSRATAILSQYLGKIDSEWVGKAGVFDHIQSSHIAEAQSVTYVLKSTPGAIALVEIASAIANGLGFAKLVNQAGMAVEASLENVHSAIINSKHDAVGADLINPPGERSYPIQCYVLLIAPEALALGNERSRAWRQLVLRILAECRGIEKYCVMFSLPDQTLERVESEFESGR
jgi:phosphate transport system substrate-binding protein